MTGYGCVMDLILPLIIRVARAVESTMEPFRYVYMTQGHLYFYVRNRMDQRFRPVHSFCVAVLQSMVPGNETDCLPDAMKAMNPDVHFSV